MGKTIASIKLTDNLTISACTDGYWLYDCTRGMNLSMRAKTSQDAFVEAITYYQQRTKKVEEDLKRVTQAVDTFFDTIVGEDEDCY